MLKRQDKLTSYDSGRFKKPFRLSVCLVSCAFFFLVARLWYLQIVKGDELRQRSENNRIRFQEVKPLRGLILDSCGNIVVDNQPSFDISIIPEVAKDINNVFSNLVNLYDEKGIECSMAIPNKGYRKPFVPIKIDRNIGRDKLALVETNSLILPGVIVDVVPVRKYIYGEMIAHVLGYIGEISVAELQRNIKYNYNSRDIVGKEGIEKCFDKYLKGESGGEQIEVNVTGRKLNVLGRVEPVPGCNIVLTIDSELQKICWDAFDKRAGVAIVMNPRDGSILALISKPSFDPNLFNRGISGDDWKKLSVDPLCPLQNRAISGQYPPGSTFKLIVAAAALEEGFITEESKETCNGSYTVGNHTFRCWKRSGHGAVDLHKAIVESCDVYFYSLGEKIGIKKIAEYARNFGFGSKTGIGLPGENKGLVPTKEWKLRKIHEPWQIGETVSASIGQGFLLVTPLQLLKAYCAIANGGIVYRPQLVKRIESSQGQIINEYLPEIEFIIPVSKENIKILNHALWGAVNEDRGTGKATRRMERDVCGKTGTSQVVGMSQDDKIVSAEEIQYKHRDHALFVCYVPRDDPEIAVIVIVEHGGHGGSSAAPIARKIIDGYFEKKQKLISVQSLRHPEGVRNEN